MRNRKTSTAWKLQPMRLADAANARFVKLGQLIARLLSGRGPGRRQIARDSGDGGRNPRTARNAVAGVSRAAGLDWSTKRALRDLFHKDAEQRLVAAQWFRRHGREEVIPALEGMLSIEENQEVRREIVSALREFKPAANQRGGERCSRSSAV